MHIEFYSGLAKGMMAIMLPKEAVLRSGGRGQKVRNAGESYEGDT